MLTRQRVERGRLGVSETHLEDSMAGLEWRDSHGIVRMRPPRGSSRPQCPQVARSRAYRGQSKVSRLKEKGGLSMTYPNESEKQSRFDRFVDVAHRLLDLEEMEAIDELGDEPSFEPGDDDDDTDDE